MAAKSGPDQSRTAASQPVAGEPGTQAGHGHAPAAGAGGARLSAESRAGRRRWHVPEPPYVADDGADEDELWRIDVANRIQRFLCGPAETCAHASCRRHGQCRQNPKRTQGGPAR